jgi:hypothetical protein
MSKGTPGTRTVPKERLCSCEKNTTVYGGLSIPRLPKIRPDANGDFCNLTVDILQISA